MTSVKQNKTLNFTQQLSSINCWTIRGSIKRSHKCVYVFPSVKDIGDPPCCCKCTGNPSKMWGLHEMRDSGWNIWKGFACFSSLSWFWTLENTEPPLKSPQLGLKKEGASWCTHSYSVQWSDLTWSDSSASTRPQCEGGGVAGSPSDFTKKHPKQNTVFRLKSEKQLNSAVKSCKKGSRINCEIVK